MPADRLTSRRFVLGVLLLWALLAQAAYSAFLIYVQINHVPTLPLPFTTAEFSQRIDGLQPGYEHSGLQKGDTVIALNGEPVEGEQELAEFRLRLEEGETISITVDRARDGNRELVTLPVQIHRTSQHVFGWTTIIGLGVLLPLSCLGVGFYIAFGRPFDPLAWITLALLLSFGHVAGSGTSWAIWSPWRELLFIYHPLLSNTWPLWMILFACYFPVPFPWIRRFNWILWLLAVPCALLTALEIYANFESGRHISRVGWIGAFEDSAGLSLTLLFTCYVFAFFFLLVAKKRILPTSDAKRRLQIMISGFTLSLLPLLPVVLSERGLLPALPIWVTTSCLLMLVLFPITMAYVIVVQRAMDVRMVVRLGVKYAIASTSLRIARLLLILLVAVITADLARQSGHRWEAFAIAGLGTGVILAFGHLARRATNWMDKRFFREAYDAERVLSELSNSVATIRDKNTLIETVSKRIAESLHVQRIAVLLERGERYVPVYARGFNGTQPPIEFRRDAATIRTLKQIHAPSRIYFDDPQSWVHGTSPHEQSALQTLHTQVLLPVNLDNRMLGIISLGPKQSEAPYSKADLHLLGAVASQTGLALENADLTERIRHQIAQRERLDRELEIAREVQQRLFPQKLPLVQGLDFAGYCRPALGVGGDYYDFIRLPDTCLGIAVGDVSGKGIAAALMMACLQASLRGQTIKPCATLSEMIQHINRLVYEASADNRYATFFYAQYDPGARLLRYVNAGHNAPILYRRAGRAPQIIRLEEGGTVIGLFADFPYQEAQIPMRAGDILVAFTDGVSEAMDRLDNEFEEWRLIEAIREAESRTASDIITHVLARVDAFTAGAQQHDDMTLVVIRVNEN